MNGARVERADLKRIGKFLAENALLVGRSPVRLEEKISDDSFMLTKYLEGNRFVGFVEVELLGSEARINALVLGEEFRGKGIGAMVIENTLEGLKENGIERVSLLVSPANLKAKGLYEKAGFEFVGVLQDIESGDTFEEMEIELAAGVPSYVS